MNSNNIYRLEYDKPLWVKLKPEDNSTPIDVIMPKELVEVHSSIGGWLNTSKGWIRDKTDEDGNKYFNHISKEAIDKEKDLAKRQMLANTILADTSYIDKAKDAAKSVVSDATKEIKKWQTDFTNNFNNAKKNIMQGGYNIFNGSVMGDDPHQMLNLKATSLNGILGAPYQWLPSVDMRPGDDSMNKYDSFGRKYAERIVARMPLLMLTPGEPEFMGDFSNKDKKKILGGLIGGGDKDVNEIVKGQGMYYSFKSNYSDYVLHVREILRTASMFLGIGDDTILGTPLKDCLWGDPSSGTVNQELGSGKINYAYSIPFYINSDTQVSESFGNSTTKSSLAEKVNQMSAMGRELQFILGGAKSAVGMKHDSVAKDMSNKDNQNELVKSLTSSPNIISQLLGDSTVVLSGGKIMFPEIWDDSSHSSDHSIEIKLATPDADLVSWFMNIMVPIGFLLPFVLPRQVTANGYVAPFIMQAFYKGFFNVNLGICTSMSISRGDEGGWNQYGLPLSVTVQMGIKDLYEVLMTTTANAEGGTGLLANPGMLNFLSNFCGLNIQATSIAELAQIYVMLKKNYYKDRYVNNVWMRLNEWALHTGYDIFAGLSRMVP